MGYTADRGPRSGKRSLYLLALILASYLALGSAYVLNTPLWQAPDEPAHFNYVRDLALGKGFPVLQAGDYNSDYMEKIKAAHFPTDMSIDAIRYESHQPPLYYSIEALVYRSVEDRPVAQQVFSLRLFSLLLGVLLLSTVFRAVGQVFPGQPSLALGVVALAAFIPQHLHISGSVDNDILGELLLTGILLWLLRFMDPTKRTERRALDFPHPNPLPPRWARGLLGRPLRWARGSPDHPMGTIPTPAERESIPSPRWERVRMREPVSAERPNASTWSIALPLGLLLGLAFLAKTTSYVAVPLVAFGLALGEGLGGDFRWTRVVRTAGATYAIALAISGWWFVRNILTYGGMDVFGLARHDQIVVGQPRVGVFDWAAAGRLVSVGFQSFWAQFGWMGVPSDSRTYAFAGFLTLLAFAGLLIFLARQLRRPSLSAYQAYSLVLLASAFLLVLLGVITYNLEFIQPQGRYLFPALLSIGVFLMLGLRELMGRRPALGTTILSIFLFVLAVYNLWRVLIPGFAG